MKKNKILNNDHGFTLIEALIAMVILSIGIFALYSMQVTAVHGNSKANRITTASIWNADQIEKMIGRQYSDFNDESGNGRFVDADNDGVDDNGGGFGLDDPYPGDVPLLSQPSDTADGYYQLYWNVAEDIPVENLKTVRVHIRDKQESGSVRTLGRSVSFTYILNDTM